jgi:diguanylate cyclase (GGDEF)-like protein
MLRLWNRKAMLDLLIKELSRAKRFHSPFSVFLADVDFFKHVNDTHGHLVGDEVLRGVSTRISEAIRRYDNVGRYGGEEFLAVLPDWQVLGSFPA